jgi:hypothetical protein
MKKTLLIIFAPLAIYAGSNVAFVECKTGTGRTTLNFLDDDLQGSFKGGTLTIDNKSINYLPDYDSKTGLSNTYSSMVVNMKQGVYTLLYNDTKNLLTFYAIPKSVKKVKKDESGEHYKFNGIIEWTTTDPRNLKKLNKQIWISCKLDYSL